MRAASLSEAVKRSEFAPSTVTHWLLSSGVTGAAAVALSLDAAAEFLLEGAGLAEVDAVVVLPLDQPVISIALIANSRKQPPR